MIRILRGALLGGLAAGLALAAMRPMLDALPITWLVAGILMMLAACAVTSWVLARRHGRTPWGWASMAAMMGPAVVIQLLRSRRTT